MSRIAILVLLLAAALGATAASAAEDPRAEKVRLRAADVALARRAVVASSDLGPGWRRVPAASSSERVQCPGFDPDFSAFTITGKAQSAFARSTGASVVSAVEVYATRAQAAGDFRAGAKPGLARCLAQSLGQQLRSSGGIVAEIVSARMVPAPRVGDLAAAWRIVISVRAGGQAVRIYVDVLSFQRGRSVAAVVFTGVARPLAGRVELGRRVALRMR